MSKRLQVLLDEQELSEIRIIAHRQRLTVAEWVRQTLRAACRAEQPRDTKKKLRAVQAASKYHFPTGDIEEMLAEIEKGYGANLHE